jgi:hypothetical protein
MNGACTAEITGLDEIAARISMHPLKARTEAAMADDVLDYAAQLPKNSLEFARLRAKLRALGVTLTDWNQAVQQRQTQRKRTSVPPPAPKEAEERPKIVINKLEEFEVNEAAVEALARLPYLYQRFGLLTRVLDIKRPVPGRKDEKETALEIRTISPPFLRELFTRAASWHEEQLDPATGEPVLVRAHPPEWSVKAVYNWQSWPHIRPLHHISEIPVLLSDGTLLSTPGYDAATGILYEPRVEVPPIPDLPTEQDIDAAKLKLLDIVDEFPFEKEVHRSAFFAALLTPIARWAFEGQSPLFMFDANQAGSGKGLLTRVIGLLALGHQMDLITSTSNEEEERKRITAKLLSGATMVLIDNIGSMFGSQVLEALLTTSVWSERLLGSNDAPRLDAWITWYGSGNNVQYAREDTRRRVCTIRVVTNLERPEERDDYKYRDLEGHVKAHRGELLAAALTILRGWLRTGKKASELSGWGGPWGSYDGWDQVVRGALVYAGLPDPIAAKATKDGGSAKDAGLRDLVEGLDRVFVDETQDLNRCQVELALRACAPGGRICAVGDDRQAIYAWRGADPEAVPRMIDRLDAKVLPLSVTYRCARQIVKVANEIVPDLEAAPGAAEGLVANATEDRLKREARPGDFILSRTNAPLVGLCLSFLAEGRPATVAGRDVGAGLTNLIRKSRARSVPELCAWVDDWAKQEAKRLEQKGKDRSGPKDKADCVRKLAEGARSVDEVLNTIQTLFSDKDDGSRIVLSTTHRAKGLERDRAWVLRDTYRRNSTEEENLWYVAVTRAKRELLLVQSAA